MVISSEQFTSDISFQITTFNGKFQPGLRLRRFSCGIVEFADERFLIPSAPPRFNYKLIFAHTDRDDPFDYRPLLRAPFDVAQGKHRI